MSVNITLTGDIYNHANVKYTGSEVRYQAYFRHNVGGSSPSVWGSSQNAILGQYNFNLADIIGTGGFANNSDAVVVVLWEPNILERNSLLLNQWVAFEVILGTGPGMISSAVYVNNVQITTNIFPDLSWSLPATGFVNTNYIAINNSDDVHNWVFNTAMMNHWLTRYSQNINIINAINNSDYDWGDLNQDTNLPGASNGTHQWSVSGYYDVDLSIEDECGSVVSGTKQIQIFNHAPTAGITMVPANPSPDEIVTFQWTGIDVDSTISSIDWQISDSGVYGNTDTQNLGAGKNDIIDHINGLGTDWCGDTATAGAFTNPGTHNVFIVITWYDGFSNQTIPYNKDFTQGTFSGPAVNFAQDPTELPFGDSVSFDNTSTNTDRVGRGLPNCEEYDWEFNDNGTITTETNKLYTYAFTFTPTTISGIVTLTANWQDGWQNLTSSIQKSVVFATTVTIAPEDCYYSMDIIGTSSDGSITGYSWEIYKDTTVSGIGPWDLVWSSPVGLDENNKKMCFTSVGYYRIKGYVYGLGATTSDYEDLLVNVVCPVSDSFVYVWNGTGIEDTGGDWDHSGSGFESEDAKYSGTNGLDATGLHKGNKVKFNKSWSVIDISDYDLLVMWINIRGVSSGADIEVYLHNVIFSQGDKLNLSNYIDINDTNTWQKVSIPLEDFNINTYLIPGDAAFVNRLTLAPTGDIGIYLDDIVFAMGVITTVYTAVPVCRPEVLSDEIGEKSVHAREIKPSMRTLAQTRRFPGPINL